jgi:mannose-6-phosphate isomerase-like protein (cupin superfamily)
MSTAERFHPISKMQPWGKETLVACTETYTGKVLERYASGQRAGLQYHEFRDETFFLYSGEAYVYYDGGDGQIVKQAMVPGQSFHIPAGIVHSVESIGYSVMFEASHPDNTPSVPVEAAYADQMRALGASKSVQG